MNTIEFNKGNTLMVAHRGVSGLEMENSIAAFVAAGNRSYYGIETDVHVTKDEQIVVFHDDNTLRTTGIDKVVEECTLEELQAIPLYNKEAGTSRTDLRMPILSEYINICKKYEKKAVLELKNTMEVRHIQKIVDIISQCDYLSSVIFISFSWDNCVNLRKMLPSQRIQFLKSDWDEALIEKMAEYDLDFDVKHTSVTKDLVDKIHANGHVINVWTVNEKEDGERLAAWGVDFITTNILE